METQVEYAAPGIGAAEPNERGGRINHLAGEVDNNTARLRMLTDRLGYFCSEMVGGGEGREDMNKTVAPVPAGSFSLLEGNISHQQNAINDLEAAIDRLNGILYP